MLRIGIVAGEPSGDRLGASLITALRAHQPVEIRAMAGPMMREAGCTEMASIEELSVMGLLEVAREYPRLRRLRQRLINEFVTWQPDVLVGIDVPDFALEIERQLKSRGTKAVHFVCPQIWAWRSGRVRKIREATDLVLTLFPFEAPYLVQHSVAAEFVGHPLADRIPLTRDTQAARAALGFPIDKPLVALLPGSRRQEFTRHLPLFLATAERLAVQLPEVRFIVGAVDERMASLMSSIGNLEGKKNVSVVAGHSVELLMASDVALCVSGTVTLEAALTKTPMVVAYKTSTLSYEILKQMVKTKWIALPNLLLEREIVPEYIQQAATPAALAAGLLAWLQAPARRDDFAGACLDLHRRLRNNAGEAAARAIARLVESHTT